MIIDTNAVSAILAGEAAIRPIIEHATTLVIPAVVLGEYRYGITASHKKHELTEALDRLLRNVSFAPVDEPVTAAYAEVRRALKTAGTPIPENDVWIAATARRYEMPLLSKDSHFDVVPGIRRVGW
jgi:predicted nucleic acid-binding protein